VACYLALGVIITMATQATADNSLAVGAAPMRVASG
jgi:hypothetical protein